MLKEALLLWDFHQNLTFAILEDDEKENGLSSLACTVVKKITRFFEITEKLPLFRNILEMECEIIAVPLAGNSHVNVWYYPHFA